MVRGASKNEPVSVSDIANDLAELMRSLPEVWIEGQLAEVKIRPGFGLAFLSLRDVESEVSLQVACTNEVLRALGTETAEGLRVVLKAHTEFWTKRGSLMLRASAIETVGKGDLLAQLAELQERLRREGLFDAARKKRIPYLPQRIGLICGRASDAMHDVVSIATRRWPSVKFEIREVAVQGASAVKEVSTALRELDALAEVDVIIIARGGGAFEDLMVFSDESLLRLVSESETPIVSAIGHEEDSPLLDLVADVRASTPTDAARRAVPELAAELELLDDLRDRIARVMAEVIGRAETEVENLYQRGVMAMRSLVTREREWLLGTRGQIRALSPLSTLARGYAIVLKDSQHVIRSASATTKGQRLLVRFTDGEVQVLVQ